MARRPRYAPSNCIHHIFARGNNKQQIFMEEADYLHYLAILKKYKKQYNFHIYHYALMNNHVHLLAITSQEGDISRIMKCVNSSYALFFRKKYGGIGHFWQDRFKNIPVLTEQYYLKCAGYIELNPVKAGLVLHPKDYKWSSYKTHAYGYQDDVIDENPFYGIFGNNEGERRMNYVNFIDSMMKQDLKKIGRELTDNTIQCLQERFILKFRRCFCLGASASAVILPPSPLTPVDRLPPSPYT